MWEYLFWLLVVVLEFASGDASPERDGDFHLSPHSHIIDRLVHLHDAPPAYHLRSDASQSAAHTPPTAEANIATSAGLLVPASKFFAEKFAALHNGGAAAPPSEEQLRIAALAPDLHLNSTPPPTKPRVVVTGLGVVSAVGTGVDEFWPRLIDGYNPCSLLDHTPDNYNCRVGCQVKDFKPAQWYTSPREANRIDRYGHFAMAASKLAMKDAKLDSSQVDAERFGVLIGSGIGGLPAIEREMKTFFDNPRRVSPLIIPASILNVASGSVAVEHNARGPNFSVVTACASGTHTIGEAFRVIQRGDADVMIAGSAESTLNNFTLNGFNRLGATASGWNNQPQSASRPFDKKRSGFVMGEGAGVLILETEEHALMRGAHIYGELAGYGSSCDAFHVTAPRPDGSGLRAALKKALDEAEVPKEAVGYINAHGTSTPLNDKAETKAIKEFFGEDIASNILVSSSKSMTGHCLGAAGGIEAVVIAKALETGIAPPTINYEVPDPECDLFYCPNKKVVREGGFEAVMSNSLGFGGQNAVLVMKKWRP